jgi:hypothetical protein
MKVMWTANFSSEGKFFFRLLLTTITPTYPVRIRAMLIFGAFFRIPIAGPPTL